MNIVLYAFDQMADWEYAHLVGGLALARRITRDPADPRPPVPDLVVASADGGAVRTLGGVQVQPDCAIADLDPSTVEMLVLPGGDGWPPGSGRLTASADSTPGSSSPHSAVLALAHRLLQSDRAVAGICAATRAMAEAGFLDEVPHTSNGPEFLAEVDYAGDSRYIDAPAVGSGDVVTAAGTAPVDFAREVFRRLQVFTEEELESWCNRFASP